MPLYLVRTALSFPAGEYSFLQLIETGLQLDVFSLVPKLLLSTSIKNRNMLCSSHCDCFRCIFKLLYWIFFRIEIVTLPVTKTCSPNLPTQSFWLGSKMLCGFFPGNFFVDRQSNENKQFLLSFLWAPLILFFLIIALSKLSIRFAMV